MTTTTHRPGAGVVAREELDVRVEDYLNDKLQTGADLANIDALLESVHKQQTLLEQQVPYR